jgi:hypothetical protein
LFFCTAKIALTTKATKTIDMIKKVTAYIVPNDCHVLISIFSLAGAAAASAAGS